MSGNIHSAEIPTVKLTTRTKAILLITVLGILWFCMRSAPRITGCVEGIASSYCDYFWTRGSFPWHVGGALVAVSVGLIQIWLGLTGRFKYVHRILGRIYLVAVAIAGIGSIFLMVTAPEPFNEPYRYGLVAATIAWIACTAMGYRAARGRSFAIHRQWMTRGIVISMLFVVFRIVYFTLRPINPSWFNAHDDDLENVLAWASWCIPLIFLEIYHHYSQNKVPIISSIQDRKSSPVFPEN